MTRKEENILKALTPEELEAVRPYVLRLSPSPADRKDETEDKREQVLRDMQLGMM